MSALFGHLSIKKTVVSLLTGIAIAVVTWFYLNSYYTLGIEDGLLSKETFFERKLIKLRPEKSKKFVFISTGKDLNLVDDTAGYGNIAVSDRYKIFKLLQAINIAQKKPSFILLDLQFYYPYIYSLNDSVQSLVKKSNLPFFFPQRSIDDSLQAEIKKNKNIGISVLLNDNKINLPIYKGNYGIADYKTFGAFLNKFRIYYGELGVGSIPCIIHQKLDGAVYSGNSMVTFCNHHLCFNYIWPDYYYDEENIKSDSTYQLYHIGSLAPLLNNSQTVSDIFKDKVVFIGNFEDDTHATPAGTIPGTVVLADIYLTLLNGKHYVPYLWILFVVAVFSLLSYMAIYNQLPVVEFNFGFAFADQISAFIKEYISYMGILLLLSVLSLVLFNITISLFLPALIFSAIDFFLQKKYLKNT